MDGWTSRAVVDGLDAEVDAPVRGAEDVHGGDDGEDERPGLIRGVEEKAREGHGDQAGERGDGVSGGEDEAGMARGDVEVGDGDSGEGEGAESEAEVDGDRSEGWVAVGDGGGCDTEGERGANHADGLRRAADGFHRDAAGVDELVREDADAESEDALEDVRDKGKGGEICDVHALGFVKVRGKPTEQSVHAPTLRELRDANGAHFSFGDEISPNGDG